MAAEVEITLRGPEAYALARKALEAMEAPPGLADAAQLRALDPLRRRSRGRRWPGDRPACVDAGEPFTEAVSEDAGRRATCPQARLTDEIRDAGDVLSRELDSVSEAIETAQKIQRGLRPDPGRRLRGPGRRPRPPGRQAHGRRPDRRHPQGAAREQRPGAASCSDSTEEVDRLREHLEQVRRDAMTDALTNLANRKAFDEAPGRAPAPRPTTARRLTLAVLDIDHFKRFNDTWGHQTGDQVLRYVASVIGRVGDSPPRLAARYGGEEFAMIFPGETPPAVVRRAGGRSARRSRSRMLKRRSTNEDLGAVTISVGVAAAPPGESADLPGGARRRGPLRLQARRPQPRDQAERRDRSRRLAA